MIDLNNTEIAFAHLSDNQLKTAYRIFWLTDRIKPHKIASFLPLGLFLLPGIKRLLKRTLFQQFVGGETLEDVKPTIELLAHSKVGGILDYGVEGQSSAKALDQCLEQFQQSVRYATSFSTMHWISVKLTALFLHRTLEQVNEYVDGDIFGCIEAQKMDAIEHADFREGMQRLEHLVLTCEDCGKSLMIDAEESWIQDAIDVLATMMMKKYNRERVVVANTFQLYRKDKLAFLQQSKAWADKEGFLLGAKIVRGAYIDKEAEYARARGKENVLFETKEMVDLTFDEGMRFCMQHSEEMYTIVATHNDHSILFATRYMQEANITSTKNILFSQLYGMGNHLTFNLAEAGFCVDKYVPYGQMGQVLHYLLRRAKENSSIDGQTSRELLLLEKEIKRREI